MEIAKEKHIYRTSVLAPYEGCSMFLLQKEGPANKERYVYRVEKDYVTVVFKRTTCSKADEKAVKQIREEYDLSKKAYEAAGDGVVKPISCEEAEDTKLQTFCFEAVYEYGGENLLTALENSDAKEIMDVMEDVAQIMAKIETKGIFHSDIKPQNIVISNDVVKLLDFGVAMSFDQKTRLFSTKNLKGGTLIYLPPEVLEKEKGKPAAVDVYSWGITLYQLLTRRTCDLLENDMDIRTANYKAFLKNVMSLKIERDPDEAIKKKVANILPKVLDFDPKKRPNFPEIGRAHV